MRALSRFAYQKDEIKIQQQCSTHFNSTEFNSHFSQKKRSISLEQRRKKRQKFQQQAPFLKKHRGSSLLSLKRRESSIQLNQMFKIMQSSLIQKGNRFKLKKQKRNRIYLANEKLTNKKQHKLTIKVNKQQRLKQEIKKLINTAKQLLINTSSQDQFQSDRIIFMNTSNYSCLQLALSKQAQTQHNNLGIFDILTKEQHCKLNGYSTNLCDNIFLCMNFIQEVPVKAFFWVAVPVHYTNRNSILQTIALKLLRNFKILFQYSQDNSQKILLKNYCGKISFVSLWLLQKISLSIKKPSLKKIPQIQQIIHDSFSMQLIQQQKIDENLMRIIRKNLNKL